MADFHYFVRQTEIIPDSVTLCGREYPVSYEEDDFTTEEGRYYPPHIEYGGEIPVKSEDTDSTDFRIEIDVDKYKGEFHIVLFIDGSKYAEDTFYPENTPVSQAIDRFTSLIEEWVE